MSEPIQIPVHNDEDALRAENRTLRSELRAANERIADLASQIDWKSKAKILTEAEAAGIADLRAQFETLNDEQNKIVKYIRDTFPSALGARSVSVLVIGLLDELKALKAAKAKRGFFTRLHEWSEGR